MDTLREFHNFNNETDYIEDNDQILFNNVNSLDLYTLVLYLIILLLNSKNNNLILDLNEEKKLNEILINQKLELEKIIEKNLNKIKMYNDKINKLYNKFEIFYQYHILVKQEINEINNILKLVECECKGFDNINSNIIKIKQKIKSLNNNKALL